MLKLHILYGIGLPFKLFILELWSIMVYFPLNSAVFLSLKKEKEIYFSSNKSLLTQHKGQIQSSDKTSKAVPGGTSLIDFVFMGIITV